MQCFRMIRKEPVNGEFFAPERSEHELSAEIGVLRDIPDDPLLPVSLLVMPADLHMQILVTDYYRQF